MKTQYPENKQKRIPMKKMITLVVMLALAMPTLLAQEGEENQADIKPRRNPGEVQTLFDPHSGSGGYGAFTIGYTQINQQDAILIGGRGEWVIGHGFGLGLGGYGFINDPIYNPIDELNYSLAGGYGGLMLEPILFGWFPVHLSFPILVGAGGVANTSYSANWSDPYEYYDGYVEEATAFFVAEFGAEVEFNLVRFFRLAVFGSYRYTSDIIMEDTPVDALRGWSAGMTFKFGSF
jgi:opacity protein-like surface antigen